MEGHGSGETMTVLGSSKHKVQDTAEGLSQSSSESSEHGGKLLDKHERPLEAIGSPSLCVFLVHMKRVLMLLTALQYCTKGKSLRLRMEGMPRLLVCLAPKVHIHEGCQAFANSFHFSSQNILFVLHFSSRMTLSPSVLLSPNINFNCRQDLFSLVTSA